MNRLLDLITPANTRDFVLKSLVLAIIYMLCDAAVRTVVNSQIDSSVITGMITTFLIALPFALFVMWIMSVQRSLKRQLLSLSQTDSLTGLSNRAHFMSVAAERVSQSKSSAALMIDLDHFKGVNDTYGHYFGDLTLRQVAEHLQREVRTTDIVGRIGGEEFIILMPEITLQSAQHIADRICQPVRIHSTKSSGIDEVSVTVTMSVGGVMALPDHSLVDVMSNADEAMYQAKRAGRAQVVFREIQSPVMANYG